MVFPPFVTPTISKAFNTNGIVYDNSPWRPGRDIDISQEHIIEDERKLKNLATRIMSNGVEVLVKDKGVNDKSDQRRVKHITSNTPTQNRLSSTPPNKSLISSAVATVVNRQHMSTYFPLHQFMQHNYIIKTCMTTYTYLTTVVQNKRSAVSTFETIVSVVTTESLTNVYATDVYTELKPTQTKYMDVKTVVPTSTSNMFSSHVYKINKRIDNEDEDNFDLIQPSEIGHASCTTTSCSCSHTKTENLKTKFTNVNEYNSNSQKYSLKTTIYSENKINPTSKEPADKKTKHRPYDYESTSQIAPTDKIVEKYTEVISDYSEEKETPSLEANDLLTNEQAPTPDEPNKKINNKNSDKNKQEKPQKVNKNKLVVAELIKLGSLGIKGLTQLAPVVIEKMTGGFMKRHDNANKTIAAAISTTTIKPAAKVVSYNANKRIDDILESKQGNFPMYIPVDDMETAESQVSFTNATLHQNMAWASEFKHPKSHIGIPLKSLHESPLVNGGIPISPGEIITANSDVIVGKPAVGGPLTLGASGMKLQNPVSPPAIDNYVVNNEKYILHENRPQNDQSIYNTKVDDSFDLRPPDLPKPAVGGPLTLGASGMKLQNPVSPPAIDNYVVNNEKYILHENRPQNDQSIYNTKVDDSFDLRPPDLPKSNKNTNNVSPRPINHQPGPSYSNLPHKSDFPKISSNKHHAINKNVPMSLNHGRPAFLDYIPSLARPANTNPVDQYTEYRAVSNENKDQEVSDNSPSSSEIVSSKITTDGQYTILDSSETITKPFLVDIQPSKVANVLIPHGSSTALVFAGSSEPHKTGDYVDAPLPYPEPGYFGSFSIDAPQMTNVHNVSPNKNQLHLKPEEQYLSGSYKLNTSPPNKESKSANDHHTNSDNKRPKDFSKVPPPTSIQESHIQVGPQITIYNPNNFKEDFGQFNRNNINTKPKDIIDKEYENFLAVPPPPRKIHYSQGNYYDKNKAHHQRPTVNTKPVFDSKIQLNIQHPIPNQLPPKVTSEVYFASQLPNSQPTSSYTIKFPLSSHSVESPFVKTPTESNHHHIMASNQILTNNHNSIGPESSSNIVHKPIITSVDNENSYTVTLNTATNVGTNNAQRHIVGSSITVPISTSQHNGQVNADIPIGTNFAIRVEDDPAKYESVALHGKIISTSNDNEGNHVPNNNKNNNKFLPNWNINNSTESFVHHLQGSSNIQIPNKSVYNKDNSHSSLNSHANFPMINEDQRPFKNTKDAITDHKDDRNNYDTYDKTPPASHSTNKQTNSHGWYSSILNDNNIKKINVESTTRVIIPLNHDFNKEKLPDFGHKLATVGKPPTNLWDQKTKHLTNNFNIGRPFTKTDDSEKTNTTLTSYSQFSQYIPSISDTQQIAYNIPNRDSVDVTQHDAVTPGTEKVKFVYENADVIYDGEDSDTNSDSDGEISSESVKVPIVAISNKTIDNNHREKKPDNKSTTKPTVTTNIKPNISDTHENIFNSESQTEKPFGTYTKPTYHSNNIQPVLNNDYYTKPRPFTINTAIPLDHQLQQPHWQINQLMVNSTNVSYEDNMDLNIGEEMSSKSTSTSSPLKITHQQSENLFTYNRENIGKLTTSQNKKVNESGIITSTVHIKDLKPLIVKATEKSTLPTFTISTGFEHNNSRTEIIDLSPPPPTSNNNYKTTTDQDLIMGMSPPPPSLHTPTRHIQRKPQTPKPILPLRTHPPYLALPPKTLPPRIPTQRPKKPTSQDEISTYRPTYDIINKVKRPVYNNDQPSSQLLPPPMQSPSRISVIEEVKYTKTNLKPTQSPNSVIFPTPLSSGWLTSSGIEFSSGISFAPTSAYFPQIVLPSKSPEESYNKPIDNSSENSYSYEYESSSEADQSSEKPDINSKFNLPKPENSTIPTQISNISYEDDKDSETTDSVISLGNKNRTRKPYPVRNDDKKSPTQKYKTPSKTFSIIKPTRTFARPEILYPTRYAVNKIVRPLPSKPTLVHSSNIIESSESSIDDYYVEPTNTFSEANLPTATPEITSIIEKTITSTLTVSKDNSQSNGHQTHHAGNEVKISDDIIPTKTEFKTTVITHTKTLSEPPQTVSSIGYVNLTHTLTVTHTKTSLVSQSEGAVTQTLILTNTQTSTIVDVVTEVYTQVQPTTIIETVTKHIPIPQVEPTSVQNMPSTKIALDDISMSSEERENYIIKDNDVTENIQKIQETEEEKENDTFFVVMNKSQNGGKSPPINTDVDTGDYEGITRNEQVNNNGVSQVLFGEILLAGTPYLETTNVAHPTGVGYSKECQPDCKASRNERCQRIDGVMKCVCRPGFARMFPDRPCKPTYTYSVSLALGSQGNARLTFDETLSDNSSKEYHDLAMSSYEGINRMIMQSDLRDVYHGIHITKFHPVTIKTTKGDEYQGVVNDFYVQLSDNAHESRLKEVIEKYLRHNNYSLGGTQIHAAEQLLDRLNVSDFDECTSRQFHDCSEHARCFNLRGTYTCSCLEGYADLSVNTMYPGRICSSEAVGCAGCNYHGTCFERENMMICECFKWYSGRTCQVNLKAVLITVTVIGAVVIIAVTVYASKRCCCQKGPATQTFVIGCMQGMPSLHQGNMPSKQRADRRALIAERMEGAESCSVQNTSLPYVPSKQQRSRSSSKKLSSMGAPPAHAPPPPPAPAVLIPRARLHHDSRDNLSRKKSLEACSEAKLISYLESGAGNSMNDEMRRKHSVESSYSINKEKINKQGALVSAGFKVSTTVRPDESALKEERDDASSINKNDLEAELSRFDTLRKTYSQEDMSEWTDAERRIGELTLSEARSIGGTLPASTGRAASSTRLTHQEANTMAERDLGSTFLLPHVHLYKPDLTSDVSEFDSL